MVASGAWTVVMQDEPVFQPPRAEAMLLLSRLSHPQPTTSMHQLVR